MMLPITPRLAWLCRATGHRFFYSKAHKTEVEERYGCGMQPPATISFQRFGTGVLQTYHYCCGSQEWLDLADAPEPLRSRG
jgi:hypothetical protein